MTNEQILSVATKYESELVGYPAERQDHGSPPGGRESALRHARWMCQQIPVHLTAGNTGKAMRWLGFIQGVLWTSGAKSIGTMREDNTGKAVPATA